MANEKKQGDVVTAGQLKRWLENISDETPVVFTGWQSANQLTVWESWDAHESFRITFAEIN